MLDFLSHELTPMTFRGRESLAQYILRSPFSLEKMICQQQSKTVVYHSKMTLVLNQNFAIFPVLDWIATVTLI